MNDVDQTSTWDSSPHVLRIGSAEDNDVVVDDTFVSRYHAELRRSASGWNVRDLGSSNGTILSGVQVQSAVARFGDTLSIGQTELALDADGPRLLSSTTPRDAAAPSLPDDLPAADTAAANTESATTDFSPVAVERRASAANPDQTVSPDGQWRWDGAQWVPNQTAPTQPDPAPGLGTSDDSSGDGGNSAEAKDKSAGPSPKVGDIANGHILTETGWVPADSVAPPSQMDTNSSILDTRAKGFLGLLAGAGAAILLVMSTGSGADSSSTSANAAWDAASDDERIAVCLLFSSADDAYLDAIEDGLARDMGFEGAKELEGLVKLCEKNYEFPNDLLGG